MTAEGPFDYLEKLVSGFKPKEVLFEKTQRKLFEEVFGTRWYNYPLEDWIFTPESARDRLLKHFETRSLKGFGVQNLHLGIVAAGAVLQYLDMTEHRQVAHITALSRIEEEKYVWLDRFTMRNLELFQALNEGGCSFIDVVDHTLTPMGSRMLKRWVALPLKDVDAIAERQAVVESFFREPELKEELAAELKPVGDLERLVSKVAAGRLSPREMRQLGRALQHLVPIKAACEGAADLALQHLGQDLDACREMAERIHRELENDPPALLNRGGVIRSGVSAELDELRSIAYSGKDYLAELQKREGERTGISSLKIAFNNVFGYYIEVRNTHKDKVPETWIRNQTLVNAERYITEELKEYEEKILGAEDKIDLIERKIFAELVLAVADYINPIQFNAFLIGQLDCLSSFAKVSKANNYNRPELDEGYAIDIKDGRHPVIENQLEVREDYVPNDVYLDNETQQIIMITGPNMSGKSAILRQTALISLMAQMGCFVPAKSAKLGLVDKVFTRVGASDNISSGESTFMVEMNETASILNNLSPRGLVLLDELGRGTSTYDGISIAWAIAEYIPQHPKAQCKPLFATHCHELNEMTDKFPRIKNYTVSVKEVGTKILFLRKLIEGGSEHSFGIHVAKLAGMPNPVIERATKMLKELETSNRGSDR